MNQKPRRIRISPKTTDDLKAVAASRHITLRALTEQILSNFVNARSELLEAAAGNDV